jgi:nitroreductase
MDRPELGDQNPSMSNVVAREEELALLFTAARTHFAWLPDPVDDDLLRRVYELARWAPTGSNAQPLRVVFVAVGGGGLISGVAAYVKALRPDVKVIGVQMADSNAMALFARLAAARLVSAIARRSAAVPTSDAPPFKWFTISKISSSQRLPPSSAVRTRAARKWIAARSASEQSA